ncbi:MAG: hypothetical protein ACFB14_27280 [Leptolyngbyaceae cyanobacterium]
MLVETTKLVQNLHVYPDNMKRNMNMYGSVVFSQRVLLSLVEKGMSREDAYRVVQRCAHEAWNVEGGDFYALISQDPQVKETLSTEEVKEAFNPDYQLRNLDKVYQRLGI